MFLFSSRPTTASAYSRLSQPPGIQDDLSMFLETSLRGQRTETGWSAFGKRTVTCRRLSGHPLVSKRRRVGQSKTSLRSVDRGWLVCPRVGPASSLQMGLSEEEEGGGDSQRRCQPPIAASRMVSPQESGLQSADKNYEVGPFTEFRAGRSAVRLSSCRIPE